VGKSNNTGYDRIEDLRGRDFITNWKKKTIVCL